MAKTYEKGHTACLRFEQRAHEFGFIVSKPTMPECRYDYILDDGQTLHRVQVKYGGGKPSNSSNAATISLRRHGHKPLGRYGEGDVDAVVAYIPEADCLVWLKPEQFVGRSAVTIRLAQAANGQVANTTMLDDCRW